MERINLAVVVAALAVLVMSAVKPEPLFGDYQMVLMGTRPMVIDSDTGEVWVWLTGTEWRYYGTGDK